MQIIRKSWLVATLTRSHRLHFRPSLCCCYSGQPPQQQLQEGRFQTNSTFFRHRRWQLLFYAKKSFTLHVSSSLVLSDVNYNHPFFWGHGLSHNFCTRSESNEKKEVIDQHSHQAVQTALWCNFWAFCLKFGFWIFTSSPVMLAEAVHSIADFANQTLLYVGLRYSRCPPDELHPLGYSKDRYVWSLISSIGIFCLGSCVTIVHGFGSLLTSSPQIDIRYSALVLGISFFIEGFSLDGAIRALKKGAAAEGVKLIDYILWGHDTTSIAILAEDGAAIIGLIIAAVSLVVVEITGKSFYDPIGSIFVGILLGSVAAFLARANRHILIGKSISAKDMEKVRSFLKNDQVVASLYDLKSEVLGLGLYRIQVEIDFNQLVVLQNYIRGKGCMDVLRQFREVAKDEDDTALLMLLSNYGGEFNRIQKEIETLVPGTRDVSIKIRNPKGLSPGAFY